MWLLLVTVFVIIVYLRHPKDFPKLQGLYSQQVDAWCHVKVVALTLALAINKIVQQFYRRKTPNKELELHRINRIPCRRQVYGITFVASDKTGNVASISLLRYAKSQAEVGLTIRLSDGTLLTHPLQPERIAIDESPFDDDDAECYNSAGGLRIQAIDPMRTYRLLYSGMMRTNNQQQDEEPKYTHVNLRLWFRALTDAANFKIDYSACTLARCIAVEPCLTSSLFNSFALSPNHTQQAGELRGVVDVAGSSMKHELKLNGLKDYLAGMTNLQSTSGFVILRVRFEGGLVFSLHLSSQKDSITHLTEGFVYFQSAFVYPIEWTDQHLSNLPESGNIPSRLTVNIKAHGRIFEIQVEVMNALKSHLFDGVDESVPLVVYENLVKVSMIGENVCGENVGYGTIEYNNRGERSSETTLQLKASQILVQNLPRPFLPSTAVPQCVQLHDPICRILSVTGGKAAKLADIVAVLGSNTNADLKVPDGFAITVAAYENHLKGAPQLSQHIDKVMKIASLLNQCEDAQKSEALTAELQTACQQLHDAFLATSLTRSLQDEIQENMEKTFGRNEWKSAFTAVRSSAVGEDGTEASGAGQMETFLGMKGMEKICEAVKLCWASHYAFRAVQYRRQLCATLDSPMAVLVQELVKADVAGVLFTRHPDSGSTARSVINACYGIGEGVVSGHVQPDTISVYKDDPLSDTVRIAYDVLGEKATAYKLDEEKGLVEEEELETLQLDQNAGCCLDEDEIRRIYRVGQYIERIFGASRDVEFAFKKDASSDKPAIFILQARPITTADMEDDWELIHEMDSPVFSDREWQTTANIQEMMPGAMSPLSARLWLTAIGEAVQRVHQEMYLKADQRFYKSKLISIYYQHIFLNWTMVGFSMTKPYNKIAADMAFFGRKMDVLKFENFREQNDVFDPLMKFYVELRSFKSRFLTNNGKRMEKLIKIVESLRPLNATEPVELYKQVEGIVPMLQAAWLEHSAITSDSTFLPMIIMHTLDKSMDWGPQFYEDMAKMLSTCTDVFSADVPTLLQQIARSIAGDDKASSTFSNMDRVAAAKWLLSNESGKHGTLFRNFLSKHGHRCIRDSDIREKTWSQEPEKVIDAIKVMVTTKTDPVNEHKKELSVDEALNAIKTPLNRKQRFIIKWMLPKVRAAVGRREWAKSWSIKATNYYREAINRLATILTQHGYLPDADLIFFLLPEEIESLVQKRSPKLIARALRRRRVFPKFKGLHFPELSQGHAEPEKLEEVGQAGSSPNGETISVKGTAVGQGCIEGTARVVKSLAEANQIQAGDIIIVPYTDVGWTPYFPMISGLVTELGGLISHGAVVAREYGLPCLVGCKRATDLIKTGDRVYIDGHLGEIKVYASTSS